MLRPLFLAGIALLFCATTAVQAAEVCELYFTTEPDSFNGKTITVPESFVGLSPRVHVRSGSSVSTGEIDTSASPSIMFVIDHSGSMYFSPENMGNVNPNDRWGSRFEVPALFLDTIRKILPHTRAGVSVFRKNLYFEPGTRSYIDSCPDQTGGYIPLLRLDSTYAGYDGKTGAQILDTVFATDTVFETNPDWSYRDLVYTPNDNNLTDGGTNINAGFDAALDAMSRSPSDKKNQFIIFLSDGEPNPANQLRFQNGTNTPTTFTIFFTSSNDAPDCLDTMTTNIKNNNYSESNIKSNIWSIQTSRDTLLNLMLKEILGTILASIKTTPGEITVNGQSTSSFNDTDFVFQEKFPLNPLRTDYAMNLKYKIRKDSLTLRDTAYTINFGVERSAAVSSAPAGLVGHCWDRTLAASSAGTPVVSLNGTEDSLTITFTSEKSVWYTYEDAAVEIRTASGATDIEPMRLAPVPGRDTVFSSWLPLSIGAATRNNGIIDRARRDTIFVTFRNPELPLDTLQLAIPCRAGTELSANSAAFFDRNADGRIDELRVGTSAALTADDSALVANAIQLPAERALTILSRTLAGSEMIFTLSQATTTALNTARLPSDSITITETELSGARLLIGGRTAIADSMAPTIVSASFVRSADADTLAVIFSEPVTAISNGTPFTLFDPTGTTYRMTLASSPTTAAEHRFGVTATEQVPTPADSININATLRLVADQNSRVQSNSANVKRPLAVVRGVHITASSFEETDEHPDGRPDLLRITFDQPVSDTLLSTLVHSLNLPGSRGFGPLNRADITRDANGDILVSLSSANAVNTAVTADDSVLVNTTTTPEGELINTVRILPLDRMPPVIASAILRPGTAIDNADDAIDTLDVTFSEPISGGWAGSEPFLFVNKDGAAYRQNVAPGNGTEAVRTTTVTQRFNTWPAAGDSIALSSTASLSDGVNTQSRTTVYVPLKVNMRPVDIVLTVGPNPVMPGMMDKGMRDAVGKYTGVSQEGVIFMVKLVGTPAALNANTEIACTVLDAIGQVVKVIPIEVAKKISGKPGLYGFAWDLTNTNGRRVATGSYVADVRITCWQDGTDKSEGTVSNSRKTVGVR